MAKLHVPLKHAANIGSRSGQKYVSCFILEDFAALDEQVMGACLGRSACSHAYWGEPSSKAL